MAVSEEDVPALDRGFARLLAEEMRPFIKPAMEESLREFMGQNGAQHKHDHAETIPAIAQFLAERKRDLEAAKKKKEQDDEDTRRFRTQVKGSLVVGVVLIALNILARLLGWY